MVVSHCGYICMVVVIESQDKNCDVIILDSRVPILSCLVFFQNYLVFSLECVSVLVQKSKKYLKEWNFSQDLNSFYSRFFVVLRGNRHKIFAGEYFKARPSD